MATQMLPLISKAPQFRVDPDKYLREYRLPFEKKTLRQTLTPDGLAVRLNRGKNRLLLHNEL